jgi:hypothetical protein
MVKNWYATTKIEQKWDLVRNEAKAHNWNPAFVLALWIGESAASGADAYDLGCLEGERNNLDSQLRCLWERPYANEKFEDFMCIYSEGKMSPCTFSLNPNFPVNLKIWYDRITK